MSIVKILDNKGWSGAAFRLRCERHWNSWLDKAVLSPDGHKELSHAFGFFCFDVAYYGAMH